ncbi:MAG TPA: ATP-binding cassette domain-containing protein, partial [Candidatus Methylomirabilis sp.]|nr:ATP-binding cassette domain-containing protein [Candidatus Methylomirabilis sp.]
MFEGISVEKLVAWFGQKQVLNGISMKMGANLVTAIIGPSGCGKSTLIRCLNRLHETVPGARQSGRILLDGRDIYQMDPVEVRRTIGMVFQKPNPFPAMSIYDNVAAGLRLDGVRERRRVGESVERSLKMAALWDEVVDRLDKPGISLSGGQQQRLCIARAIAIEPQVLLMDEPCSA